jgi:hypothetical protein
MVLAQIFALKHITYNTEDRMNTLTQLWKHKISPFH